jgi:hypothetical protein
MIKMGSYIGRGKASGPREGFIPNPKLKLLEQVSEGMRFMFAAHWMSLEATWISLADQKWGFEGVLWYQHMSRVCPGRPQTTPRGARKVSCIRYAYGKH